jgi:3-hydroxymyristoyl/3-hydroxydecanoyl-(acyl carrier protein) dehydratase
MVIHLNTETLNYQILAQNTEDQSRSIRFHVSENIPYFIGHFPNNPVLPAVAIIDISHYFINLFFPNLQYKDISYLKVKSKIPPEISVIVQIFKKADTTYEVLWLFDGIQDNAIAAQMQITY